MIIVALSANLPSRYGDPATSFREAIVHLGKNNIRTIKASSMWHTAPVPFTDDQPWYHNAVLQVDTDHTPREILTILKEMEKDFGRESTVRNASRPLDLDLICYDGEVVDEDNLTVPHPRMHDRAFVLCPMAEIDKKWLHPVMNRDVESLLADIDIEAQGIKMIGPIPE